MSDCGKKIRLNRVLGGSKRRALVVAFDHALVLGPIPGTEDPLRKIRQFAQARVDALLLNLGLIRQFANSTIARPNTSFNCPPGLDNGLVCDWAKRKWRAAQLASRTPRGSVTTRRRCRSHLSRRRHR